MCYAKPGPRCAKEAKKKVEQQKARLKECEQAYDAAYQRVSSLMEHGPWEPIPNDDPRLVAAREEMYKADARVHAARKLLSVQKFVYDGTPEGQREWEEDIKSTEAHFARKKEEVDPKVSSDLIRSMRRHKANAARFYEDQRELLQASLHIADKSSTMTNRMRSLSKEGRELVEARRRLKQVGGDEHALQKAVWDTSAEHGVESNEHRDAASAHRNSSDQKRAARAAYSKARAAYITSDAGVKELKLRAMAARHKGQETLAAMYDSAIRAATWEYEDYRFAGRRAPSAQAG